MSLPNEACVCCILCCQASARCRNLARRRTLSRETLRFAKSTLYESPIPAIMPAPAQLQACRLLAVAQRSPV